ncbi:PREDICTED: probable RNA methyltransferase CG11342 [Bactrocera latifrons]|uniref:RNA methyltransferase n=1 Tax=Bactrocera latifrons TaxID=174628 RepID=A0A0K8TZR5_BACLA|nr:PREDICTED: probable RNA methyltransferase CG11342 [Bactrocera latifrons]
MEYRNNDPGAVQYGNFINYYDFNNAGQRLNLLPRDVWIGTDNRQPGEPYLVLDIGCNAGNLTQLLYTFLNECVGTTHERNIQILGVDIDSDLVKRAKTGNAFPSNVSYEHLDVMDSNESSKINEYLHKWNRKTFDVVCSFSVTMWIHLNHGDDGLQLFLEKLCDLAELLVVEPQPWKCYRTALRRMKKAGDEFPLYKALQWCTNVEECIQVFLESSLGRKKVFECLPTRWQRRICFYR